MSIWFVPAYYSSVLRGLLHLILTTNLWVLLFPHLPFRREIKLFSQNIKARSRIFQGIWPRSTELFKAFTSSEREPLNTLLLSLFSLYRNYSCLIIQNDEKEWYIMNSIYAQTLVILTHERNGSNTTECLNHSLFWWQEVNTIYFFIYILLLYLAYFSPQCK